MTCVSTLGLIIALGRPFSFLMLLLRRFELGDDAVVAVAGDDAVVVVGTVTAKDVLVGEVVLEDVVVVADVELAIGVGI